MIDHQPVTSTEHGLRDVHRHEGDPRARGPLPRRHCAVSCSSVSSALQKTKCSATPCASSTSTPPAASIEYLAFGVTALASVLYLWKRTRSLTWDRLAGASAEIGVLFTGITLATGMIWGHLSWGVYWTCDARLTTTALLFVLFLGYLALAAHAGRASRARSEPRSSGIIAFIDVPIVHQSVEWWRTSHQDATVLRRDLEVQIDGIMLFTLFLGFAVFTLIYAWLLLHRAAHRRDGRRPRRARPRARARRAACRRRRGADPGMSDAGWILGAYVIVLEQRYALYAIRIVTGGRSLAKQVPDEDKTWT